MNNKAQFCSQCGEQLSAGANFCSTCGSAVNETTRQPIHTHIHVSTRNEHVERALAAIGSSMRGSKSILGGLGASISETLRELPGYLGAAGKGIAYGIGLSILIGLAGGALYFAYSFLFV